MNWSKNLIRAILHILPATTQQTIAHAVAIEMVKKCHMDGNKKVYQCDEKELLAHLQR